MVNFSCTIDNSVLKLTGDVNVDSLSNIMKNAAFKVAEKVAEIDCSNITKADSSCLAFLVYLQNIHQNAVITYLPEHLLLLVELYDLENVLTLKL